MNTATIHTGNCLDILRSLPADSVHCIVTSPPYLGLRAYLPEGHEDKAQEIGAEPTPEAYVAALVEVFREVRRVLHPSGVCWLNIGDSYAANRGNGASGVGKKQATNGGSLLGKLHVPNGLKEKDLMMIPARVALALQADGWYLRADIIWAKANPMPESVTDRPTKSHEHVYLLSKSPRYFYDWWAVKERATMTPQRRLTPVGYRAGIPGQSDHSGTKALRDTPEQECSSRNLRDVWTINTQPYSGAHFAVFPPELPRRCILAGTSARGVCPKCGKPWERVIERRQPPDSLRNRGNGAKMDFHARSVGGGQKVQDWYDANPALTTGWQPTCTCGLDPTPAVVLDPFAGSGTTLAVAIEAGRDAIGIELNPEYVKLAEQRIAAAQPALIAMGD